MSLEQVIRYLFNVQKSKNDVYINSLKLSSFDYNQPVPICKATVDVVIFEKLEPEQK